MLSLLLAVLLLLGLIVVTGGLRPVPQTPLATLAVDQISRGEPWNVTVTGARLASDLTPAAYLHDRAHHWVAVIAEVEITAPESRADLLEVVRLRGIDGLGSTRARWWKRDWYDRTRCCGSGTPPRRGCCIRAYRSSWCSCGSGLATPRPHQR